MPDFKAHFLSILAGTADDFPMQLWDRLLPQAEITVNLLWQSNATPTVSAYAHLGGPFDYNKMPLAPMGCAAFDYNRMPLAPMGCAAQIHKKTDKRGTWAYHSVDGCYLGTSPEHYRTHPCYVKSIRSERLANTVQLNHKRITNPELSRADKVMHAIATCIKSIKESSNAGSDEDIQQIKQLLTLAGKAATQNPHVRAALVPPREQPAPRVQADVADPTRHVTRSATTKQAPPPR